MSLLPFFFEEEYPIYAKCRGRHPGHLLDQQFGLALTPSDLLKAVSAPLQSYDYYRPWRQLEALSRDVGSTIKADKSKFQVNLDVQHFAPEEILVKIADGYVVVEGKHEEKQDQHGYVSRQFVRRFALPEGCNAETVESRLSTDGVLTVTAPRQAPLELKGERSVPIKHTGPVKKQHNNKQDETTQKK